LSPSTLSDLGSEMGAIEQLTPAQLNKIALFTTPTAIELLEHLTPAQLANPGQISSIDLAAISLGYETSVVKNLTPPQWKFIMSLTGSSDSRLIQLTKCANYQMKSLDALNPDGLKQFENQAHIYTPRLPQKTEQGFMEFWQGYLAETGAITLADPRYYGSAQNYYKSAMQDDPSTYGTQARYRLGVLGANNLLGATSYTDAKNNLLPLSRSHRSFFSPSTPEPKILVRAVPAQTPATPTRTTASTLELALARAGGVAVYVPQPVSAATTPQIYPQDAPVATVALLDYVYRFGGGLNATYYQIVAHYVNWFKLLFGGYGAAVALIFLALLVKIVTIPTTTASFRGMRDMQRIQPLIKELQEKYKDDKQKFAEEQMKLMKEHKVNPAGSCLPMLIQIPIFIVVYQAVQVYTAGFTDAHFIWVKSLAAPDTILLLLYAASMIVSQKLMATPSADPQQKMMQTQMTYFMPIFFLLVLGGMPSAFVLYWFFLNVFSSLHQYYLMQKFRLEDVAAGVTPPALPPPGGKKKGK
jgi:YidC/Oxa1 family membrane protein insertase